MSNRIVYFDYMRVVAISLIVLGHSIYYLNNNFPPFVNHIINGNSPIFVFISGFFFHTVYFKRFEFKNFLLKKVNTVFLPFLFISSFIMLLNIIGYSLQGHSFAEVLEKCWAILSRGYVIYPYWYIPVIMSLFLLSPAFMAYIRLTLKNQFILLAIFSLISIYIHRPANNIGVIQSVIYFIPFYLFGILYSQHTRLFNQRILSHVLLLITLVLCLTWLETLFNSSVLQVKQSMFAPKGVDLMFFQKVLMCFLAIEFSKWLAQYEFSKILLPIAEASFAIFFFHAFFIAMLLWNVYAVLPDWSENYPSISVLATFVVFFLAMIISYYFSKILKGLFKEKSRMFIGW